jgi:hypothetical protein
VFPHPRVRKRAAVQSVVEKSEEKKKVLLLRKEKCIIE